MRTPVLIACLLLSLPGARCAWGARPLADAAVRGAVDDVAPLLPADSRVLVVDLCDLDNRISYFGRFLSDKLQIELFSRKLPLTVIDRRRIDLATEEFQLQQSGMVDESSIARMGKMLGAGVIVYGTVTDLGESIDISLKAKDLQKGTILGGSSRQIPKTEKVASLVKEVLRSEKDRQAELEQERKRLLEFFEEEKKARMAVIEAEIARKRTELEALDREIRSKSETLKDFEAKRAEIGKLQAAIEAIHAEIDKTNQAVPGKLKIGMRVAEITQALGESRVSPGAPDCLVAGKFFLLLNGDSLSKVVKNGSAGHAAAGRLRVQIDDCDSARAFGKNVVGY